MKSYTAICINQVSLGKNRNWLRFSSFIPRFDKNRSFNFEFCSTEIIHSIPLPDDVIDRFREMLKKDFGFPPFDIGKCERTLGDGKTYYVPNNEEREGNEDDDSEVKLYL